MYQFMIDQPAENYINALKKTPGKILEEPIHPSKITDEILGKAVDSNSDGAFTFKDIEEENYHFWTALYGVSKVEPYPEDKQIFDTLVGEPLKDANGTPIATHVVNKNIVIPEGYYPYQMDWGQITGNAQRIMRFGTYNNGYERSYHPDTGDIQKVVNHIINIDGEIPVSISAGGHFMKNIMLSCTPKDTTIDNWRMKIYNSLIEAYETQKMDYEAKKKNVMRATPNYGENPVENRRIEREEIKKACIENMLLRVQGKDFEQIRAAIENDLKVIDSSDSTTIKHNMQLMDKHHDLIAFMEEAFEWEQMLYEFIPYYWNQTRKDAEMIQNSDALFVNFLRASASKIVLAVRPGFERSVMHFMSQHEVYTGKGLPVISEDDIDLINEIDEINERLDGSAFIPTEVGSAWEIKEPTSLVVLSQDQTLGEKTKRFYV